LMAELEAKSDRDVIEYYDFRLGFFFNISETGSNSLKLSF
jgi:hypothetical protein